MNIVYDKGAEIGPLIINKYAGRIIIRLCVGIYNILRFTKTA